MSRKEQYVHSEKPLDPRQLRVLSRLLPFALPRLPPKGSMLLLFDTSEKLIVEQSSEILGVSHISWEDSPWRQLSLVDDEEVISLSHAKVLCIFRFCVMLWKVDSEPSIKYCLGRTVELVQRFTTI